ncbi:MAG: class I SAM-dependent methyltransferase [Gemmatimonadota bacterium]
MPVTETAPKVTGLKAEAQKQWTDDACGYAGGAGFEQGSAEYFAAVDRDRYEIYAPWMKTVMGYDGYRGKSVLEIGYGQGTDLMQFAKGGAKVTGVDLSPTHQRLARKRFELAGIPADLRLADAETLPFPDATFDVVYSFGVIHHTPGTQDVINEIYRVLKPGGKAILAVYHRHSVFSAVFAARWLREKSWRSDSLESAYWRIEEQSADRGARPLVKRYGRAAFRKMLFAFSSVRLAVDHLGLTPDQRAFKVIPAFMRPFLARHFGWYLIAFCEK